MVYVFLAEGFELVEAMASVDILRRAKVEVRTVGVTGKTVTASNGVPVTADIEIAGAVTEGLDCIVLPGGLPGTVNLEKSGEVQGLIDFCQREGKLIGAICAAPSILAHKGLLKGREATAFPSFQKDVEEGGGRLSEKFVCRDGQFITARGMGVSTSFGLELAAALTSPETAAGIKTGIQFA
ncbi:DJ-1 family glyoxalase III [Acutalibacter sp. 1XD8-36]|uniref:DJ-1 family glyoxalase III n=1 Tax=Acutalibacter sp. 1XD8-36 TaxID=2320852 RepID=UPI001412CA37|nr:DJ-1 family glyoxalase III [Acutalibacter sp. 1XD8-36]NBJ89613.1 DJ-1/PfpI family protein [Acutalibacter sp. 1XD8-36]